MTPPSYLMAECRGYDERGHLVHLHIQPLADPHHDPAGMARVEWGEIRVTDEPLPTPNRWAAFTDDELDLIESGIDEIGQAISLSNSSWDGPVFRSIRAEIDAELERRNADNHPTKDQT